MPYKIALMGFNGDYRIKSEQFENTDDALDFGAIKETAPYVLVVDQSGTVVRTRGDITALEGHTVEDLSARFAERL
jgi:hypothetical protein